MNEEYPLNISSDNLRKAGKLLEMTRNRTIKKLYEIVHSDKFNKFDAAKQQEYIEKIDPLYDKYIRNPSENPKNMDT